MPADLAYAEAIADYSGLDPTHMSDEELMRLTANFWLDDAATTIALEIDGQAVVDPKQYRSDTSAFTIVDDDLLEDFGKPVDPGNTAVSAGYAVMLAPMTPGEHQIHYVSYVDPPDVPGYEQAPFGFEASYQDTVEPGAPSASSN